MDSAKDGANRGCVFPARAVDEKAMRLARLYFGCDAWPQVRLDER